jgi:hypothetical protein
MHGRESQQLSVVMRRAGVRLVLLVLLPTGHAAVDPGLLGEAEVEVLGAPGGPRFARLVDGEDAQEGGHPWHVGLVREESKTGFLGWVR